MKDKAINLINTILLNNSNANMQELAEKIYQELTNSGIIKDNVLQLVPPKSPQQYFYVVYQAAIPTGHIVGSLYVSCVNKNPKLISDLVFNFLKPQLPQLNSVVVTNIIELSLSEYQAALAK